MLTSSLVLLVWFTIFSDARRHFVHIIRHLRLYYLEYLQIS
ncbi:hypothetical protein KC19_9G006800 [Ceratodon purpureus]|uniref:Uncharacterized protein n=1 Tax=Ceratodon purpureus TaxID=3225 RepID=A0A8T0GMD3_CERPU|nr:hypothetical protein KC19_9G006800 [Ceratodon purpureus]